MNNYSSQYSHNIQRPVGVSVIAVLYFISGVLNLINGLFSLVLGVEALNQSRKVSWLIDLSMGGGFIIFIALLIIGIAILNFSIGTGLLKLKNWARITAIVLNSIQLVFIFIFFIVSVKASSYSTIPLMISLIFLALIIWMIVYLSLYQVKYAFDLMTNHLMENNRETGFNKSLNNNGDYSKERELLDNYLVIKEGYNRGKKFYLKHGENIIGRGKDCNILLVDNEKFISRHHAMIIVSGSRIKIKNISEQNKVGVNGRACRACVLNVNDIISIGKYKLLVRS